MLVPKHKNVLHFIESNTQEATINHLKNDCIVPVFSKDNELTVSHAAFIETVGEAVQNPRQLRVRGNLTLEVNDVLLRVKAAGDVLRKLRDRAAAQLCGVLTHGQAVQVGHEIIAVKLVSELRPVLDRAEVVAEVQVTGGLDAREHSFLFSSVVIHNNLPFYRPYLSRRGGAVSGTAGGGSEKAQYERLYIVSK